MPRAPIRWLLVEWKDGSFGVINVKAVVEDVKPRDLTTGKLITVTIGDMIVPAKIVMSSDDRKFLELQIHPMTLHKAAQEVAPTQECYPQIFQDTDPEPQRIIFKEDEARSQSPRNGDFSASASSWSAHDWSESEDDEEEVIIKQIKRERKRNIQRKYTGNTRKKPRGPMLKVQPVIPNAWRINESNLSNSSIVQSANGVTVHTYTTQTNIIDGTKTNPRRVMMYDQQVQTDNVPLTPQFDVKLLQEEVRSCQEIIEKMKTALIKLAPLFNMANILKELNVGTVGVVSNDKSRPATPAAPSPSVMELVKLRESTNERQEQLDLSKNAILNHTKTNGTPKPKILNGTLDIKKRKTEKANKLANVAETDMQEMVRIGSGKTLVPKSIYDDIDWSSFTMATRKLLSAVFPRSVLGTHSLTGKSSPAFRTKPAKRCLEPRKVADIIMTVTEKCQVKENLVRSAITVKCADEYKMMKCQNMKEEIAKKRHRKSTE